MRTGVAGLYDLGPTGAALQSNLISEWRRHFILEEDMLELDPTIMTLDEVLKTSGHVDKFSDYMCRDLVTGDIFRADHVVEAVLGARLRNDSETYSANLDTRKQQRPQPPIPETSSSKQSKSHSTPLRLPDSTRTEYESVLAQLDNFTGQQLGELIRQHAIRAPETGNELSDPVDFNLMFRTDIGPLGVAKGYLRPETAQGHFVNFARLLEFNNGKVPFASAHVGKAFRNEISPRSGLLRVREFVLAEIEHFVDPLNKSHPRFDEVRHVVIPWLPRRVQENGKMKLVHATVGEAVESGMCDNQTLGYFIARIWIYLSKIGLDPSRIRMRQHMTNEMAHYAADCWDAEIHTSYGWIECVGCADRSAYDLTVHARRTKRDLSVQQRLEKPIVHERLVPKINLRFLGPQFKRNAKAVEQAILTMDQEGLSQLKGQMTQSGQAVVIAQGNSYTLSSDLLAIESTTIKEHTRTFVPNVVEPSFGMGRIFYALLEHVFWARSENAQRGVLSLPPTIAPIKALIVPLSVKEEFQPLVRSVARKLRENGVACRVDDSNTTIGRRYARNDELGTPFACTLDFGSLSKGTMTLRERDTTSQLVGPIDEVLAVVTALSHGTMTWDQARVRLPVWSGEQEL